MNSPNKYQASAILAIYNGATTIRQALDTLLTQSVSLEIIVVDDGSTDTTKQILKDYKQITVLMQDHQGPALARNLGAQKATTDILLFVDADMNFDKDYVKELIAPIKNKEVIGTYTSEERVANWDNVWARCWNLQEGWEKGKRFPVNPPKYGTDFRAILKSEFERVGGFDNTGYTDTWSLFQKLKKRPLVTKAICYHANPGSLGKVFTQAKWVAKRSYKFGLLGSFFALIRASLPISIIIGAVKSLINLEINFLVFKIVYDFGKFLGILEMLIFKNLIK